MTPDAEPDFAGQVVDVMLGFPDKVRWYTLDEPRVERQHGRLFLVGRMTDVDPGKPWWGRNLTACIAWDAILGYFPQSRTDWQQRRSGGPESNTVPG
ncbi:MAG TPA: hypothetical protein VGF55_05875 [Gemmataceae bacterium]|jgi:hypothetical protein